MNDSDRATMAKLIQFGLITVSGVSLLCAILHAIFPERFDEKTAMFLAVAVLSLVIQQITRFKGWGVEFEQRVQELKHDVQNVESRQSQTESEVRVLQVALKGLVSAFEFDKLVGLNSDAPFVVEYNHRMYDELRRLFTMQYITTHSGSIGDLHVLKEKNNNGRFDLKQYVAITDEGREYVRLRQS